MSCSPSCHEVHALAAEAGVEPVRLTAAVAVSAEAVEAHARWIAAGRHADMSYMERYADVRSDPRLLLPGAATLLVAAFPYQLRPERCGVALPIAGYALGRDYHEVVRERMQRFAAMLTARWGGDTRVCVDTAPLRERYWAERAGLGRIGLNNQLIVPGLGSNVVLGTLLWSVAVDGSDRPLPGHCGRCGACVRACPAGALSADGSGVDARRCLSYLTIEHRGEFPPGTDLCGRLYGCDLCQRVCPWNSRQAEPLPEFMPSQALRRLTEADVAAMTQPQFSTLFSHSAIKRTKLAGLQRNLQALRSSRRDDGEPER